MVEIETRGRTPIWRTFGRIQWHVIPERPATLQGVRILSALLPAGLRVAQPCRYCFYSLAQKMVVFAPQERHVAPINVKVGTGERIAGPLPRANFHVNRGKNVGIQPLKLSKFRILARNLYLRGDSFAIFLRNSQRL